MIAPERLEENAKEIITTRMAAALKDQIDFKKHIPLDKSAEINSKETIYTGTISVIKKHGGQNDKGNGTSTRKD